MERELRNTLREADVPVVHQVRGAFEDLTDASRTSSRAPPTRSA